MQTADRFIINLIKTLLITQALAIIVSGDKPQSIQHVKEGAASFFPGVRSWLGTILGLFSIIYFRGLGLRIRVRIRGWVRIVNMFGVMVRVNTTQNCNPDP